MPLRDKSLKPSGSATVRDDSAMPSLRFITTLLQLHCALVCLLLRLRACKPRNPADTSNVIQSKTGPSPGVWGRDGGFPIESGQGWDGVLDAPGGAAASAPSPKQGAGSCAPAVGTDGVPLYPRTLKGGLGGTTASATKSPLPPPARGTPWHALELQWVGYSLFRDSIGSHWALASWMGSHCRAEHGRLERSVGAAQQPLREPHLAGVLRLECSERLAAAGRLP